MADFVLNTMADGHRRLKPEAEKNYNDNSNIF